MLDESNIYCSCYKELGNRVPVTAFNDALLLPLERNASPGHVWVLQVEGNDMKHSNSSLDDEHRPVIAEITLIPQSMVARLEVPLLSRSNCRDDGG